MDDLGLVWREAGDNELEAGIYRISPSPAGTRSRPEWQLLTTTVDWVSGDTGCSVVVSPSRRSCRAMAVHHHRARLRRARMAVHLIIGTVAWLGVFSVLSFQSLAEFSALFVLFVVGASSFADILWVASTALWGSVRSTDPPPVGWVDRLVVALVHRHLIRLRPPPSLEGPPTIGVLTN